MANTLLYRPQDEGIWMVGPMDTVDEIWARHEYIAIDTTMLANRLAAVALLPQVRPISSNGLTISPARAFLSSTDGWSAARGPLA